VWSPMERLVGLDRSRSGSISSVVTFLLRDVGLRFSGLTKAPGDEPAETSAETLGEGSS